MNGVIKTTKGIFNRLLQVVHWCAFLSTLIVVLVYAASAAHGIIIQKMSIEDMIFYMRADNLVLLAFAPAFVAPIVLYILKGRWIIFPWRH